MSAKLLSTLVVAYIVMGVWTIVSAHHQPECNAKFERVNCSANNTNRTYYTQKDGGRCVLLARLSECTGGKNSFNSTLACEQYCNHHKYTTMSPNRNSTTTTTGDSKSSTSAATTGKPSTTSSGTSKSSRRSVPTVPSSVPTRAPSSTPAPTTTTTTKA